MTIYIALLRGINVGGKNKIKMAELKNSFEALGLERVKTYINSGNVLFESQLSEAVLREQIEQAVHRDYGIALTVILRTAQELEQMIEHCPFSLDTLLAGESIHVSFLLQAPTEDQIIYLSRIQSEKDEFQIQGRDLYLWFRQSILDSKLASHIPKFEDSATTRNWNTILKLDALAKAMKSD
ncbi:DUF1697 domain-containing protein [Paenibacillus sp. FSL H7-0331]|uniref:DUF1697 domain-containing protein n=1 Tax=Paenibacillus sp. FSL H7-0331 TaxID=1920421 RepID=UPI00096C369D|nr:DUF1697 domain-containing protein [Paenibacillus sp. FSL H7-0331]OMF20097.1 cytoplasmic protein [Paenibacillus sp. FSL H7-0331]